MSEARLRCVMLMLEGTLQRGAVQRESAARAVAAFGAR